MAPLYFFSMKSLDSWLVRASISFLISGRFHLLHVQRQCLRMGIAAFGEDGIFRIQFCFQGKIDIDNGNISVFQRAGELWRLQFRELKILFVFCDVLRCSGDGGTVTELNKPPDWSTRSARPPLVGSFGIATRALSGRSFKSLIFLEKTDIGSRWIAPAETSFRFLDRANSSRYGWCWK